MKVVYIVFVDTKYDNKQVVLVTLSRIDAYKKKESIVDNEYYLHSYVYIFALEGEVDVS